MSETEFAKKLIPWLQDQHWDVYPEFAYRFSGAIDILAVRENITWAIEVKKSLSLKVMEQASSHMTLYRSVFVPGSRTDRRRTEHLARYWFNVGVLETSVHDPMRIREVYKPPLMREHYKYQKKFLGRLTELHKTYAEPGIKNGRRLTPYRESMLTVERFIKQNPGCTVGEVFEALGKLHYASGQSFKSSLVSSLRSFEKDWCTVDESCKPFKFYHVEYSR